MKTTRALKELLKLLNERPKYALLSENGEIVGCDLLTWAKSMEHGYRRIRQETLPGGYWLSTVFLGLNHNFNPYSEKPLWFETMIFRPPRDKGTSCYCEQFSTLEEAFQGHEEAKRWFEKQEFEEHGSLVQEPEADDIPRRF
jgi:hypothetical protein